MQKIVIDTNVIVSSIIQKSYPYRIVRELFIDDAFIMCVSDALMHEYYEVLSRSKFAKFPDFFGKAENLLSDIEAKAIKFEPTIRIDLISDKNDNMMLELADKCAANFIITGNTSNFTFAAYKQTKIVTPREYWENHAPKA